MHFIIRNLRVSTIQKSQQKKTKVLLSSTSNETNSRYNSSNKETGPLNLYDVVILDYKMPGMNGMDVAKEILGSTLIRELFLLPRM